MKSSSLLSTDDTAIHFYIFLPIIQWLSTPATFCSVLSVFVYQMSACGSQLWVLFNCQNFLISAQTKYVSPLNDPNHSSFSRVGGPIDCHWRQPWKNINMFSLGLFGPTVESVLWVLGWCEVCFSSSRWRLWKCTEATVWAQQHIGKTKNILVNGCG